MTSLSMFFGFLQNWTEETITIFFVKHNDFWGSKLVLFFFFFRQQSSNEQIAEEWRSSVHLNWVPDDRKLGQKVATLLSYQPF